MMMSHYLFRCACTTYLCVHPCVMSLFVTLVWYETVGLGAKLIPKDTGNVLSSCTYIVRMIFKIKKEKSELKKLSSTVLYARITTQQKKVVNNLHVLVISPWCHQWVGPSS